MNGIGDAVVRIGPALVVAVVLLAVVAVLVNRRSGLARETVVATLRAGAQLAALAAVLAAVIPHLWASALFVAVMATAASSTSARRVRPGVPAWREPRGVPGRWRRRRSRSSPLWWQSVCFPLAASP